MFRFGSIALGLFLVGFGIYLRWFEPPMSSTPEATSLEEALRLSDLSSGGEHFVDFPGTVDMAAKLYRTGIDAPAYSSCDPRESHRLEGEWTELLGCTVLLSTAPEHDVVTVTASRHDVELAPADALRRRTLLAPVATGLWVLSPTFFHMPEVEDPPGSRYRIDFGRGPLLRMQHVTFEEETWIRTESLSGPLARLIDLPRLREDFEEGAFAEGLQLAMGAGVDASSTYVVLADGRQPVERPSKPSLPRVIAPVVGATNLFVALGWDSDLGSSERITGVLEPLGADRKASVIRLETPDEVNRERESTADFTIGLGAALIFFGVVLIAVVKALTHLRDEAYRARRRR